MTHDLDSDHVLRELRGSDLSQSDLMLVRMRLFSSVRQSPISGIVTLMKRSFPGGLIIDGIIDKKEGWILSMGSDWIARERVPAF